MKEGKIEFEAGSAKVVNKQMGGFYNPEMKYVRDLTLAVLLAFDQEQLRIALPLAGTGIKALRILKELPKSKISYIQCNDHDKKTFALLKYNAEKFVDERLFIANEEADEFLLYRKGFDYIDLDPYGSPNPYLDATIKRISNHGILGITATDVRALAGSARLAGLRKYGVFPESGNHEKGIKTLIKKIISVGAQYDKALTPIISVSKLHYYRIFFSVKKSKSLAAKLLQENISLHNKEAKKIISLMKIINKEESFNNLLEKEILGGITNKNHVNIHKFCKKHNFSQVPKTELIIKELRNKGFKASRSHLSKIGIWTDTNEKELKKIIILMLSSHQKSLQN